MNLVHIGHKADSVLDNKIALISNNKPLDLLANNIIEETAEELALNLNDHKTHALFFTATWCDWYLKDSRPAVSQQCVAAQQMTNQFQEQFENIAWHGIISRLWTGEAEMSNYVKKYQIKHPIAIDASNTLFHRYGIKDLPSLVLVKNGKILFKTTDFSNKLMLSKQLAQL